MPRNEHHLEIAQSCYSLIHELYLRHHGVGDRLHSVQTCKFGTARRSKTPLVRVSPTAMQRPKTVVGLHETRAGSRYNLCTFDFCVSHKCRRLQPHISHLPESTTLAVSSPIKEPTADGPFKGCLPGLAPSHFIYAHCQVLLQPHSLGVQDTPS